MNYSRRDEAPPREVSWYASLRMQWKPDHVRLLLIGESAPDDGGDPTNRRFFYADHLTGKDNLFRAVVHALYDEPSLDSRTTDKRAWLTRLQRDGVFLIDLVPYPINGSDMATSRSRARHDHADECADRAAALSPDGIIVCHGPSFKVLRGPLVERGLPLLHEEPIPFPLGNWRAQFFEKVRGAIGNDFATGL
ncbi:hypothetical protein [Demequina sp.]|uniref:hypothetical protein n=1 Tax=Demequina sp. TaxID=2050685 RepID=UPI003A88B0FB